MIHLAPLVLMLLVLTTMTKGTGQTLSKLLPIAKQAGLSAASFLCAVTLPALTGALRSGLSGGTPTHITKLVVFLSGRVCLRVCLDPAKPLSQPAA